MNSSCSRGAEKRHSPRRDRSITNVTSGITAIPCYHAQRRVRNTSEKSAFTARAAYKLSYGMELCKAEFEGSTLTTMALDHSARGGLKPILKDHTFISSKAYYTAFQLNFLNFLSVPRRHTSGGDLTISKPPLL